MHEIKEMLMDELYEYKEKMKKSNGGKLSVGDIETIHKLTDTIKNIDKIEMLEEGYSEATDFMGGGRIYGSSYARGRNARRDSMGRYSRDGEEYSSDGNSSYRNSRGYSRAGGKDRMVEMLHDMMDDADSEQQRTVIHRWLKEVEKM